MRSHWIRCDHNAELIVFLNGWGMDGRCLAHLPPPPGWDLLMVYNYTQRDTPAEAAVLRTRYDRVVMIAWSMGVWAAGEAFASHADVFDRAVAINGTACPIDDRYGISPALYRAMADGFSEKTRNSFYRRMCHSEETLRRFLTAPPARSIEDQGLELHAILDRVEKAAAAPVYPFDEVLIGARDRIMRPENQKRFWADQAPCRILSMPHYPFLDVTWKELLCDATARR